MVFRQMEGTNVATMCPSRTGRTRLVRAKAGPRKGWSPQRLVYEGLRNGWSKEQLEGVRLGVRDALKRLGNGSSTGGKARPPRQFFVNIECVTSTKSFPETRIGDHFLLPGTPDIENLFVLQQLAEAQAYQRLTPT
mmetsp:Transcript_70866/g.185819  ORF Transcript_70866/g.185819 Transcript_70866/m.185819 type:complete len:136 (-) Transcript_70866:21-428(-)